MSYTKALDVSRWQGVINWAAVKAAGYEIAIIKMSGSDDGDYYDGKATANYNGAKAAGLAVGGYHFAGGTDAAHEAEYFVKAMSPLEENDVLVLDWENNSVGNPVAWCETFVNRVHELTGTWPLIYMSGSRVANFLNSSVLANCGLWVAWYGKDPEGTLPVNHVYVMHQYTSGGSVPGISGNVDLDAWFGSVDQFNKYGYHHANAQPSPQPTPEPAPTPEPTPEPAPVETPAPTNDPTPPADTGSTPDAPTQPDTPAPTESDSGDAGTTTPVVTPAKQTEVAILLRAFHTFWQAFVSVFVLGITNVVANVTSVHDFSTAKSAILALVTASVAAGLSALKNLYVKPKS